MKEHLLEGATKYHIAKDTVMCSEAATKLDNLSGHESKCLQFLFQGS